MANNFTQLYVQLVFAVSKRDALISPVFEERLFAFIGEILVKRKHTPIAINGADDHIHILFGLHPDQSISDLVRDIKSNSSRLIRENHWTRGQFSWQRGFGAFSYSQSQIQKVARYVMNQKEHHRKTSFREEMMHILDSLQIPYDPQYLFEWILLDEERA